MPFGKYADFQACVDDQSKDHDVESAKAICGKMQAEMGGSNFVEYSLDANGDLYLKYFFADKSIAKGSAVGDFTLDDPALDLADTEAKGLPFSILPSKDLSIKGDWHSWSPKEGATWQDHVDFARQYSPGHIETITRQSNLVSAAMSDIKANNGRLAVIKITDKRARDAFIANPALIPRQVSPGFMNLETPNLNNIKRVKWAHLAAVPKGAYGDKATLYGSCIGGNECVNALVAASVKELDSKLKNTYCPIGASENISSLSISEAHLQNRMSDTANTVPSTPPVQSTVSTPAPQPNKPAGAPITTGTPEVKKGIVRLKTQAVTPQSNQQIQGQEGSADDITKLKEEVAKMREIQQQNERREQIKKIIPKELFINKGKFDEKAFEAEVEKRLQSGATDEQLNEFYSMWMEKQKLINAGYEIPQAQTQPMQQQDITSLEAPKPMGGSYKSPSDVPAETGGSDVVNSHIKELLTRIGSMSK